MTLALIKDLNTECPAAGAGAVRCMALCTVAPAAGSISGVIGRPAGGWHSLKTNLARPNCFHNLDENFHFYVKCYGVKRLVTLDDRQV